MADARPFIENGFRRDFCQRNMEAYAKERDDLETPSKLDAVGLYLSNMGAGLDEIDPFTTELTDIVDKMKEELANEARILEGTDVPEYAPLENELSAGETKEDQWTTDLRNGCLTIVRIPTCGDVSSNLLSSARPNSPASPTNLFGQKSSPPQDVSSQEMLGDCGSVIDATNASSECTVPMISELTLGTQSAEK